MSVKSVIDSIRKAAEENPTAVYTRPSYDEIPEGGDCLYVHGDTYGCIVGKACLDNGANRFTLAAYDEGDGTNGASVVRDLFGNPTEAQGRWIDTVQRAQDSGSEWASAVAEADEMYGVQ